MSPANLIILLSALVSLTLLFQVALAGLLFLAWRRFKIDERSIKYTAQKTSKQLIDIVVEAQRDSKNLLLDSQKIAQSHLADIPDFSSILEKQTQTVVNELLAWQEVELKKLQKTWSEKLAGAAASSQHEMQGQLQSVIDAFSQELSATLKSELQSLSAERSKLIADTQTELATYIEEQKKQVAATAETVLPQLLANAIQKQLSPDEQHELVMSQLQEAWEEGLMKV